MPAAPAHDLSPSRGHTPSDAADDLELTFLISLFAELRGTPPVARSSQGDRTGRLATGSSGTGRPPEGE